MDEGPAGLASSAMSFNPLSAVTSIGSSLLNYFGGKSAQEKAIAAQADINKRNLDAALDAAHNTIQWRVADAQAAGINPLYALGAPSISMPSQQVGAAGVPYNRMGPLAAGLRDLGQDLTRSSMATSPPDAKVAAYFQADRALDLEQKQANIALTRARTAATVGQPGTAPGQPFVVPENPKQEQRPQLMIWGRRWDTNPNTSPMKAWEDQYGDEGLVASMLPWGILGADVIHNSRPSDRGAARPDLSGVPGRIQQFWNTAKSWKWFY